MSKAARAGRSTRMGRASPGAGPGADVVASGPRLVAAEDRAYQAIRRAILDGTHGNGAHIDAGGVAAGLGVSRTPVREAFRRLHAEGLVTLIANRGAYVTASTRNDLDELFGLRVVLESHAAAVAAERFDAAGIAQLCKLADGMEDAAAGRAGEGKSSHALQQIMSLNAEFHRAILAAPGNRRLTMIMSTLVDMPLIMRTFAIYDTTDLNRSMAHHRELIAAFRARDGDWAAAVMRSHLRAAQQVLLRRQASSDDLSVGASPKPATRVGRR